MPFGTTINGTSRFVSARDIGNMGAGIVAAKNGIGYLPARLAFDIYQGGGEKELRQEMPSSMGGGRHTYIMASLTDKVFL